MSENAATVRPPAEAVTKLTELMRSGRTAEAERQIKKLAAKLGEDGQEAVLAAVLEEPQINQSLSQLEYWLDGTVDLKATAPVAVWWAVPASGIDLETSVHEVRLFIDNYPSEGRKIPILQASASDWLVRRLALSFDAAPRMPAIRASIAMLVRATRLTFPDTHKAMGEVLADYDDEKLWFSMAEMIVRSQLVVKD
jgi:phosphoribosyl-ATP pyrophosphohydrolase